MKTFLKVLASVSLSLYAIISFIRLDIDLRNWVAEGRFVYVVVCFFISFIACAMMESEKPNNRL
jgi:hypothetical protein